MSTLAAPAVPAANALRSIALAGNPNSGKTTLFNALTGMRQKVANYPGVTVEKKSGRSQIGDGPASEVIDLPGTYSLVPHSPDEEVAMQVLRGLRADTRPPTQIVVVVDASNLARSLYLVSQLIELGTPLVVALNMTDIAERRGVGVDAGVLAAQLGVTVVPVVGNRRRGIAELKQAILAAVPPAPRAWSLPAPLQEAAGGVAQAIATAEGGVPGAHAQDGGRALRLLSGDLHGLEALVRLPGVAAAIERARAQLASAACDPLQAEIEARYRWIDEVVRAAVRAGAHGSAAAPTALTERVDAVLVHRVWGLLIFAAVMATLFVSIFVIAKPVMDALSAGIDWLGDLCTSGLAEGALKSLLADGVFKGVGGVVVFVPQIALLFLFLAVLEDSGYLARAAFLMDRLLAKAGLHGKSFIPLLSSFACAIPGVMAARTIERPNERLATILVAPFMSCSARLPVYTLLIGAFFSGYGEVKDALLKGGIMLACYLLGIVAAVVTSLACRWLLGRGEASPFILEMPSYKVPQFSEVLRQMWSNTSAFLTKAGTTIFCLSILLWALAYYPRLPAEQEAQLRAEASATPPAAAPTPAQAAAPTPAQVVAPAPAAGATAPVAAGAAPAAEGAPAAGAAGEAKADEHLEHAIAAKQRSYSWAGRLGHGIEPLIAPLGFDWKMGVGLVAAFAAREVFVSTMGIVYSLDEEDQKGIQAAMVNDRAPDGHAVWSPLVAVSLLVWFVIAMQCMSTFAVVRRETASWRWPLFQLAYMNALAYVACLVTYQVGARLFS
jgi:ferrous iron transport protein B